MNSNKTIIGLTGIYCSGKSTAEKILKEKYHYFIIDVDKLGHLALVEKKEAIISFFGEGILTDSQIDRKKLGLLVFRDKKKLAVLNSIVHPFMVEKVKESIHQTNSPLICIDAALLFEMNLHRFCQKVLIVKSKLTIIIKRGMERDHRSLFQILRIIINQKVLSLAKKNSKVVDILYIDNNKNLTDLENQLQNALT